MRALSCGQELTRLLLLFFDPPPLDQGQHCARHNFDPGVWGPVNIENLHVKISLRRVASMDCCALRTWPTLTLHEPCSVAGMSRFVAEHLGTRGPGWAS